MAKGTKPLKLNLSKLLAQAGSTFGGALNAQNQNSLVNQQAMMNQQASGLGTLGRQGLGGIGALTGQVRQQSPWEAHLAGREPTSTLAYEFLTATNDGFAAPLNIVLGDLRSRIKELEDTNPFQKSYDQIADEKEAKNGT
jgi:hypothetical protein